MKIKITFLVILCLMVKIRAQSDITSQQASQLAKSSIFQERLSILLDAEAMVVLRESNSVMNHNERTILAKNILYSPDSYSATLAKELVFDTNLISAGFTVDSSNNPIDSNATDGAIRSQIATNWNSWCGIS